jgi:hypothetical protein
MKRMEVRKTLIALAALAAIALNSAALAAPLSAGIGKAEIVPASGMPLSGYGQRINKPNTGTHDPVYARALVLESNGKRAAVVNADILMLSGELRNDVAHRVADLKLDFLAISATHTHYSIGAYIDNKVVEVAVMGKYDPKAYQIVADALEKSIRLAAADLAPASVAAKNVPGPGVTKNRRHPGGPTDPSFRVLGVWGADGKLRAAIINHAIHPTTMPDQTTLFSGDNAGAAERLLEDRYPGAIAMFMNAGEGDQSPSTGTGEAGITWEQVNAIGARMADTAAAALAAMSPAADVTMTLYDRKFTMPKTYARPSLQCWGGLNQLFPVFGRSMIRTQGELMGLGLNDALFLFSPAELAYEVQAKLESDFPGRTVFVVVHANDYYGYVVTSEDFKTGGYETCMSFYGADFADVLEQQFQTMVTGP